MNLNRQYLIIGGIGALVILIGLALTFGLGQKPATPEPVSLEMWGFEDGGGDIWEAVITKFRETNPHVSVQYKSFAPASYEEMLVNRLAEGKGPDIFLLTGEQLEKQRDKILALPPASSPLSPGQFSTMFVDGAARLMGDDGTLYGTPVFMDSLILFYNKDMFDAAGFTRAPATWDEFTVISRRLTTVAPNGDIVRSGAAMGSASNVSHAMELVSALILQQGDPVVRRDGHVELGDAALRAFDFYASFTTPGNPNYTWMGAMPESLHAFATESAAMAFGFSDDIARVVAENPHLNFATASFPQPLQGNTRTYGAYMFPAVSRATKNMPAAWQFALYASSREGAGVYLAKTARPPARRDIIETTPEGSGSASVLARSALIARNWPVPDEKLARRVFNEAIDGMARRTYTVSEALGRIRSKLQLLFP
ncbi:MAG: extracellular solute-binding protein [Candidatus Sungbacteria bacterium]|nr:extracellular solute-binding protein [Candidatus Sungbacteria bacterium]